MPWPTLPLCRLLDEVGLLDDAVEHLSCLPCEHAENLHRYVHSRMTNWAREAKGVNIGELYRSSRGALRKQDRVSSRTGRACSAPRPLGTPWCC